AQPVEKKTGGGLRAVGQAQGDRFQLVPLRKAEFSEAFGEFPLKGIAAGGASEAADTVADHERRKELANGRLFAPSNGGTCRLRQLVCARCGLPSDARQRDAKAVSF